MSRSLTFTIPSRHVIVRQESLSPLIQVSLPRRSNGVSTSVMCNTFNPLLRYTINLVLLGVDINSTIISQHYYARSTHQTQQPFYTTVRRQENHVLRELRLRVASSDHATFECGSDLLKLNGQPWSCSLYNVSKYYTPLYEKLREDGFISEDLDAILSTLPKVSKMSSNLYFKRYIYHRLQLL